VEHNKEQASEQQSAVYCAFALTCRSAKLCSHSFIQPSQPEIPFMRYAELAKKALPAIY